MYPIVIDIETAPIDDAETYLEPVSAPSNYKDEQKIAAYIAEERARQLEKAALDVDLHRIIALGISRPGYATEVMTTERETESDLLRNLWNLWEVARIQEQLRRLVGFNILGFDLPALLRRSLYLGVSAPYIQIDRFKHPEVIDLMATLSLDGKLRLRGLQFYLNRFRYPHGGPDITGAEIGEAHRNGDWQAIERHVRNDVDGTKWLAERIGAIPRDVTQAQHAEAVGF